MLMLASSQRLPTPNPVWMSDQQRLRTETFLCDRSEVFPNQFCCLPPLICCCPRPPRPQTPPYLGALSASALSADGSADLCFFRPETISQPAFNSRLTVMVLTFWTVRGRFPNPTPAFPSSSLLLLRAPACLNGSFKNSRLNSFKVSF